MSTTPDTKTGQKAPKAKAEETLKVAYTKTSTGDQIADVVVFGTDDSRTAFLRDHPDTWWRLADLKKGQTLSSALKPTGVKSDA